MSYLEDLKSVLHTDPEALLKQVPTSKASSAAGPSSSSQKASAASNGSSKSSRASDHAFMNALRSVPNARTTNSALAHRETRSALLDLQTDLAPHVAPAELFRLLDAAYKEDALNTLRLIWQGRSIPEGKGLRTQFYLSIAYLYEHHFTTLIKNLHLVVKPSCAKGKFTSPDEPVQKITHGFFKDLVVILQLALKKHLRTAVTESDMNLSFKHSPSNAAAYKARRLAPASERRTHSKAIYKRSATLEKVTKELDLDGDGAKADSVSKKESAAVTPSAEELLAERLKDPKFACLYRVVADIFASHLKKDLASLAEKKTDAAGRIDLSLAAKWVPGHAVNHQLQLRLAISILMFGTPNDATSAKIQLQQKVISPLRKALDVPESRMSTNQWDKINYPRVASKSMQRNKVSFAKHDLDRFCLYLENVMSGKRSISGAALLPCELLQEALTRSDQLDSSLPSEVYEKIREKLAPIVDAQWNALAKSVKEESAVTNCLAVCDVSGSMGFLGGGTSKNPQPVEVAISLTILLAQIAEKPWKDTFISFSSDPKVHHLQGTTLREIANNLSTADWGMNTDYNAVFTKLILPMAIRNKLKPEEMIKRLFVFSDMQFDSSVDGQSYGETEHQAVKRAFEKAGYPMPELVFWNIQGQATGGLPSVYSLPGYPSRGRGRGRGGRSGAALPITASTEGVQMLSGYSAGLMKAVLRGMTEEDAAEKEAMDKKEKAADLEEEGFIDAKEELDGGADTEVREKQENKTALDRLLMLLEGECYKDLQVYD